jgi:hypothetical protein
MLSSRLLKQLLNLAIGPNFEILPIWQGAVVAASACHSMAISAHANLKSALGASRPSLSHTIALRRYLSDKFMAVPALKVTPQPFCHLLDTTKRTLSIASATVD